MSDNFDNPYQTPKSTVDVRLSNNQSNIWRKKSAVVVTRDTIWPKRCIKCNEPTEKSIKRTLVYLNPWFYLTIIISVLVTIVLALIFQKKFKMDIPICDNHIAYRKRVILINWLLFLATIGGFWLAVAEIFELGALISVAIILVMFVFGLSNRFAFIGTFKDPYIHVRGAKKAFLDSLDEFNQ